MAISPKTIRMQDEEFWDAVKTVITLLVPIFGVTYESYELVDPFPSKSAVKGKAKSMGSVQKRLCFSANADLADRICRYLACSPDTHVPLKDFVCDISGHTEPLALDEQGLVVLLWTLSRGTDSHDYVTAMCLAAYPLFREGNNVFWDDHLLYRYTTKKLPLWGMLPKKRRKKQAPKPATPVSTVLQRFLRHCCQENKDKDAFLPARDLYDTYREFSLLQREQPLLFKDFNRTLEQSYGFKRVRRHTSKNSNKTGFYGIMLLDNMDEIAFTDDTEVDAPYNAEMSRTSFGDSLRAMEAMVQVAFPDFPFGDLMSERKSYTSVSD